MRLKQIPDLIKKSVTAWLDDYAPSMGAAIAYYTLFAITPLLIIAIGKFLIGLYLGKVSVASGFGAAGSLVILLLWVYFGAQIFLFGAEFTWVYSNTYGSRAAQHKRSEG